MSEPIWLEFDAVIAIHLVLLKEHGGAEGTRDEGLLEAAVARPQQLFAYEDPKPDLCGMAAAYTTGIVRNHPFVDGNKRTGFVVAGVFLGQNGLDLVASEVEATSMVIALAASEMDEKTFAQWFRERTRPRLS